MRAVRLLLWTLASIQQTTNTTRPLSRARGLQTERIVWCRRAGAWHGRPHMGANTIRYDTRCYFNVRSKADISQLNLPHGNDN